MADLSITVAEVQETPSAKKSDVTAGEAVTQGEVVAGPISSKYYLCDADHTTSTYTQPAGIALNAAEADQPLKIATQDDTFTVGTSAAVTPGEIYLPSRTAGGIMPVGDVTTTATQRISVLGIGIDSGTIKLKLQTSTIAKTS